MAVGGERDLGVEAGAAVAVEPAVPGAAQVDRPRRAVERQLQGGVEARRDAERLGEVVAAAARQHRQLAVGRGKRLDHQMQGAVAAGHHQPVDALLHRPARAGGQILAGARHFDAGAERRGAPPQPGQEPPRPPPS